MGVRPSYHEREAALMQMLLGVSFIYAIRFPNGKHYVGKSTSPDKRWYTHLWIAKNGRSNNPVYHAIQKYKTTLADFQILELCPTAKEDEREQFWVSQLNCVSPNGYNLTNGGSGGGAVTAEIRQKISAAHKGKPKSEDQIRKMSLANLGKKMSPETRQRMSEASKGRPKSDEFKAKITGRTKSEETKKKIGDGNRGKVRTPEHRKLYSDLAKARAATKKDNQ